MCGWVDGMWCRCWAGSGVCDRSWGMWRYGSGVLLCSHPLLSLVLLRLLLRALLFLQGLLGALRFLLGRFLLLALPVLLLCQGLLLVQLLLCLLLALLILRASLGHGLSALCICVLLLCRRGCLHRLGVLLRRCGHGGMWWQLCVHR